jgi:hypothetical protein
MSDGYTRQLIEELQRKTTRIERQNQALKHGLYFAISAIGKLAQPFAWAHPLLDLCDRHLESLKTLVPEQKNATRVSQPGGKDGGMQDV